MTGRNFIPLCIALLVMDAFSIIEEADRQAGADLWPGFEAVRIPALIHHGDSFLFRHPSPPDGFEPVAGREGVYRWPGRHPQLVANTSIELDGVRTATLMQGDPGEPVRSRAAVLLHEKFHVHQRTHFPGWSANEGALFTYPVTDPDVLAARRLESLALRRALAAGKRAESACWARLALQQRRSRFERIGTDSARYERDTELNEGLATYVEHRALGTPDAEVLPGDDWPVDGVRHRAYRTGLALGRLLDRHAADWRTRLSVTPSATLDGLLDATIAGVESCAFEADTLTRVHDDAVADVDAYTIRLDAVRDAFLSRDGWRVVVDAAERPLMLRGFDPLNVQRLATGEVLHLRMLRLGHEDADLAVLNRQALSTGAGAHPLFEGVRMVTLTGIEQEPQFTDEGGVVSLDIEGLTLRVRGSVERTGETVTVKVR